MLATYDRKWSRGQFEFLHEIYTLGGSSFGWGDHGYPLIRYNTEQDLKEAADKMKSLARMGYKEVGESKDIRVQVFPGGEHALVTCIWEAEMKIPGHFTFKQVKNRVTMVLVKKGGKWHILHDHYSPLGKVTL